MLLLPVLMLLLPTLLLLLEVPQSLAYWHAYNSTLYDAMISGSIRRTSNCSDIVTATKPLSPQQAAQKKLWPGLSGDGGETMYGFEEGLDILWTSQHRRNCSSAQYIVSGGWPFGFGSRIHVEGYGLAIAMQMDRIYLPHPTGDNIFWETSIPHCQAQRALGLECFYEPWSNCTINDALQGADINSFRTIHICDVQDTFTNADARRAIIAHYRNDRVLNIVFTKGPNKPYYPKSLIPVSLQHILHCSPVSIAAHYYWWRALSASFLIRPNALTLSLLRSVDTLNYNRKADFCVALFVRHGDKGIEMNLVGLKEYLKVADFLFNVSKQNSTIAGRSSDKVSDLVFITTDDNHTLSELETWGKISNKKTIFTSLFDRSEQTFSLTYDKQHQKGYKAVHDKLEYISMLLNLEYALKCDAWVCTLASNSCRVIDELRSTVAAKAGNLYADISEESCGRKPCIGFGVFNWGD